MILKSFIINFSNLNEFQTKEKLAMILSKHNKKINMKLIIFKDLFCVLLLISVISCSNMKKPDLPVNITYRKSAVGEGYVVQFFNKSNKYIAFLVNFENKTLNKKKTDYIELSPGEIKEIGWMEGWKFISGEKIRLSHEDYKAITYKIP